jgi:hypothetical protein
MAQVATPTFDDLRAEGHRGEIVYVTDQGGAKVKGRVVNISATAIDLLVSDGSREWAASDVARITQRHRHPGRGALIGLIVGFGLGAVAVLTAQSCSAHANSESGSGFGGPDILCGGPEMVLLGGAFFGGIGAGAGAAIGAAIRTEGRLYEAPGPSAHAFSFRVAPDLVAMRAQLRF